MLITTYNQNNWLRAGFNYFTYQYVDVVSMSSSSHLFFFSFVVLNIGDFL